jgi:hypothetical protein
MATRSRIAIENQDGTVSSVYSHWDGYPSHNGRVLFEHYKDSAKLKKLIDLGSLSILAENVDIPEDVVDHSFANPNKNITVFYGRDRGEKNTEATTHPNKEAFLRSDVEEYGYLLTVKGVWLMANGHKNSSTRDYIELEEVLKGTEVGS